ncbi:MAG: M3 family metallopeptidase [Cryomorphaceae bacterium]|nr:M3 family metallopeptidase [Cryomorphaceae bacterium]
MNVLLKPFETPFSSTPFDRIKTDDYLPSIQHWIEVSKSRIASIRDASTPPTFSNTVEALEFSQEELNRVSSAFFNLNSAETSDEMQAKAQEIAPLLSAFGNDIILDEKLFERIKSIPEDSIPQIAEAKMLYQKTLRAFERNGANLSDEDKEKLRNIDTELSALSLTFAENVLRDTNSFKFFIEDQSDLAGLPEFAVQRAADAAEVEGQQGKWLFSLKPDSYLDFMKYSSRRGLREKMYRAFAKRGMASEEKSNLPVIQKIVDLRRKRAKLLGYNSHAHFTLEERMAGNEKTVWSFLQSLEEKALPYAKKDIERLRAFAENMDGISKLEKWDVSYYMEKLKKRELNIDDEALKPYLPLPSVTKGIFSICKKLYGISFKRRTDVPVYHQEVETYEVLDENGNFLALFYMDFYPRSGKRAGAWMTSYRGQSKKDGEDRRPHISIVCNFNRPGKKHPALLTFQELTTYFHEFGHALHGMLARGTYGSLSGTNVYWDFVELPSQIFENWCYEKESLDLFARHIETGEPIPEEIFENIKKQRIFFEGYATIRQLTFAKLDMSWHSLSPETSIPDIFEMEKSITRTLDFLPEVEDSSISAAFSHIFQGGYAAGYYSYKWSEMLESQAFKVFEREGIFSAKTAAEFRKLLETGGAEDPAKLFETFVGDSPKPDALLDRIG